MTTNPPGTTALRPLVGTWTLDPAATTVAFTTKALWLVPVKATARATTGSGTVTADGLVRGTLEIDATSVDTGNAKRDEHLRGDDFFSAATYPVFSVEVRGARPTGSGAYDLDATMTIHGTTRPLTLPATVTVSGGAATVTVETDIDRSEWGVSWAKMGAGLKNHVVVTARFTRDAGAA
jgi:polyisoprenoid-binding protein YceI